MYKLMDEYQRVILCRTVNSIGGDPSAFLYNHKL